PIDQTPEPMCRADPESLVRTAVCESNQAALGLASINLAVRDTDEPGVLGARGDPHRSLVVGGHCKVCAFVLRQFLSDQPAIEEPMDSLLVREPDIALAIDQLRVDIGTEIVCLRILGGGRVDDIGEAAACFGPQQDRFGWDDPDAV